MTNVHMQNNYKRVYLHLNTNLTHKNMNIAKTADFTAETEFRKSFVKMEI